jgi:hypothetical protein
MRKMEKSERIVVNINTTPFKPFLVDGKPLIGQSFLQLDDTFLPGTGFHIYRMEPGSCSQPHEHTCHEQFLVIAGEVSDDDGYVYKPGDFVLLKTGTRHSSYSRTGAILAVFIRSAEKNI